MIESCPRCGSNLVGTPIPEDSRELFGGKTHFSRIIAVEVPEVYDGGLFYACPDCSGRWHRWPEGHVLRTAAEPYV